MATTEPVSDADYESLDGATHGAVLRPGDEAYDEARSIWNAMIDRRPAVIVQPSGPADVMTAVDFAREHDRLLAVKGAGHSRPSTRCSPRSPGTTGSPTTSPT